MNKQMPTETEIESARKAAAAYLNNLASVMRGDSRECLQCHATVTNYRKVARCVYAEPCGHRQWNGELPKA